MKALKLKLDTRSSMNPPTNFTLKLVEYVLTLNFLQFNGKYYTQITVTAKETKMAWSYAIIAMNYVEGQIIKIAEEVYYPNITNKH